MPSAPPLMRAVLPAKVLIRYPVRKLGVNLYVSQGAKTSTFCGRRKVKFEH